jgi:hypothetical protein
MVMPGPLIRPPSKKQVIVGSIAFAVAVGIMALAGSTGRLASEVAEERRLEALAKMSASATPEPTAGADCLGTLEDLTDWLIATQDALRQAADGGEYSKSDLDAAAEEVGKVEDKGITACEDADPASADKIHAAIDAVQDAADASSLDEEKAAELLDPIEKALALAE